MLPIQSSPYRQTASFNPPLNYSPAQVLPTMASTRMHTGFPVPMNSHPIPTNIQYQIPHHQQHFNTISQQKFQLPQPQIATIPTFQHNVVQNIAVPPLQRTETRVNYVPQKKQVTTMVDQEIQEIVPKERTVVEYIPVQTIIEKVPQPVEVPYEVKVPVPVQVPYYVYPNGQTQMINENTNQFPQQYTQQYANYPQQQQMITQQQPIQQQMYQQPSQQFYQGYQAQPQQQQQIYNVQQPIISTELQKSIEIKPSQQNIQQIQQPQGFQQQFNQYPQQQQQQFQQIPQYQQFNQYPQQQQFISNGSPNRPQVLPYAMDTKDDSYESDSDIYDSDSDGSWNKTNKYKGGKGYWEDFQNSTGNNQSYGYGRNSSSSGRYVDRNSNQYQGNNGWNDYEGRRNMGRFGARGGQQQNYNQNQMGQRRLNRGDYYDQSKQRNI